ncbi:MAG: hypothetical protein WCK67_09445 [bacterium]
MINSVNPSSHKIAFGNNPLNNVNFQDGKTTKEEVALETGAAVLGTAGTAKAIDSFTKAGATEIGEKAAEFAASNGGKEIIEATGEKIISSTKNLGEKAGEAFTKHSKNIAEAATKFTGSVLNFAKGSLFVIRDAGEILVKYGKFL